MIKLFQPYVSKKVPKYVKDVLLSGQLAEGPKVKEFEELFAEVFKKKNPVAVNSGTSALELAYDLAGIKEGDEVITPILTCTATNVPLARRGANIVFADIDPKHLTISVPDVVQKITNKTKAVVFVHFGGNNYNLKQLKTICDLKGITLIEDAAQALGSTYWGVGQHTAISLQAIKTITAGDGGIYLGNEYKKAKKLRWFGYDRDKKQQMGDANLFDAGYKFHMNDISAAIGIANLEDSKKIFKHKLDINTLYREKGFQSHPWLTWGFTDRYDNLKKNAEKNGFEIGQHHYRNDKYTIFGGRKIQKNMDSIEKSYFFVPSHMGVSLEEAEHISRICQPYMMK